MPRLNTRAVWTCRLAGGQVQKQGCFLFKSQEWQRVHLAYLGIMFQH